MEDKVKRLVGIQSLRGSLHGDRGKLANSMLMLCWAIKVEYDMQLYSRGELEGLKSSLMHN
jgi:hypothetical protein